MKPATVTMISSNLLFGLVKAEISMSPLFKNSHTLPKPALSHIGILDLAESYTKSFEGSHSYLTKRQQTCPVSGYAICANIPSKCCPIGDSCFAQGCCLAGYEPCSSTKCYNPSTSNCCSDGTACKKGYDCDHGCCPSGAISCSVSTCYYPDTEVCCPNGKTCPTEYECQPTGGCCLKGRQKCGDSDCYDPNTSKCCTDSGSAWACPLSSQCASDGQCLNTSIRNIPFRYDPNRKVRGKDGILYDAVNAAILQNMCRGIQVYLGYASQTITLTRTTDAQRRANREAMCPKGWCADALKEYLDEYYKGDIPEAAKEAITMARSMSCDEFPFAISAEGGNINRGVRFCVPSAENSWQGGVMGNFFKEAGGIRVGDKFNITIEGFDCNTLRPMNITSRNVELSIDSNAMYKGYDPNNPSHNLIVMPLGDLQSGSQSVRVNRGNASQGDLELSVLTYDGRSIDSRIDNSGLITFSLTQDEDAVSVIGVTTQSNINISYTASNTTTTSRSYGNSDTRPWLVSMILTLITLLLITF